MKMPLSRDTRVIPSNIVLDRGPGPQQQGEIWGSEPPVRSDVAFIAKLFPPLFLILLRGIAESDNAAYCDR